MSPELQNSQDTLTSVINRLNAAQTLSLQFEVQLMAANRTIAQLEAKIKELEPAPAKTENLPPIRDWSNGNGHDTEAIQ